MTSLILYFILLLLFSLASLKYIKTKTTNPIVIGILTQPSFFPELHSPDNYHYIGDCYVNQLKSEGAVVVPIVINQNDDEIRQLIEKINGVVIPGGDLDLFEGDSKDGYSRFTQVTQIIVDYSIKLWEQNQIIFPVWGTCQGFESLLVSASQKKQYNEILEKFDNINISKNIQINAKIESRMFNNMSQQQLDYSQKGAPYFYWHFYGISPEKFESIDELGKYFQITSTSVNQNGQEFVATFEGINGIPIYASQFHPERVFVWLPDRQNLQIILYINRNINHSMMSFNTNQYFGKFLIQQAKKNNNCFESFDQLQSQMIEFNNYSLEKVPKSFMACYFFKVD